MTALAEPTPIHDLARDAYDRHVATLTLQEHRQQEDPAAELGRPHLAGLRELLEAGADPAVPTPNRVAMWALEALFPVDGDPDPEQLCADATTLGCELVSVGQVLVGAVSKGLLPEGAVAEALQEAEEEMRLERERLRALARDIQALADDGDLHEALAGQLLRYLPPEVQACLEAPLPLPSPSPRRIDVVSPALNAPPDERAMAAEVLAEMREGSGDPQEPEDATPEPGYDLYAQRAVGYEPEAPEPVAPPVAGEGDDWPAVLADPDEATTEVIEPADDETQEIGQ